MSGLRRNSTLVALLGLAGCSFASAEPGLEVVNSCSMATECAAGTECQNGMCIAQKADGPLTIALEVTPVRMRDGSDPLPLALAPFTVDEPTQRTFELIEPTPVKGVVRSVAVPGQDEIGQPIEADVSFTPVGTIRGIPVKTITISTARSTGVAPEADFEALLLSGRTYRMAVRPRDTSLPPHSIMVSADQGLPRVEYPPTAQLPWRDVVVSGDAYDDLTLRVRALSSDGAEPISSTATVVRGMARLHFRVEPGDFTLEIRAETIYPEARPPLANQAPCDSNTPANPVFTASSEDVTDSKDDHLLSVALPKLPMHIRFEGIVKLCDAGKEANAAIESVAISLHASDLLPFDSVLSAAFDASTTARFDPGVQDELPFCVQVIPELHYEVLATPASTLPCALLAAPLPITEPTGQMRSVGLDLPAAAYLSGTLRTMDAMPLRGAAIDAIAIGGKGMLYNRSRPTGTGVDGSFKLQVDLGQYDVMIKPAQGSGLPWQVRHNVEIGAAQDFTTAIDMHLPLTVQGALRYRGAAAGDASLKDAVVTAYAIVEDGDVERAVPIGSATADVSGRFTLLLPPSIQSGWLAPTRR